MSKIKTYCSVHHFYYMGDACPLCQNEKFDKMLTKMRNEELSTKNETSEKEPSSYHLDETTIDKLKSHFAK